MLQLNFKLPVASCWWILFYYSHLPASHVLHVFISFCGKILIFFLLDVGGDFDKVWWVPGNFDKF